MDGHPLALYIHIPYCVHKCSYCDFHSRVEATIPQQRYIDALLLEAHFWRQQLTADPRPIHTLFLGGGTPSLFDPQQIARLLTGLKQLWSFAPGCEITLEANPESLTPERLAGYGEAGINRVSMGVQGLTNDRLTLLERPHDGAGAHQALRWLAEAGFTSWSADLIYATPGHTPAIWQRELEAVLDYDPPHLSCYALTLEPGTPMHADAEQGHLTLPGEEMQLELFNLTHQRLTDAGRPAYEVSNFAKPGHCCRHNLNYWRFGDYLGLGAAAHGKLTEPMSQGPKIRRTANRADAALYMEQLEESGTPPLNRDALLSPVTAANECLMMGLRTLEGVSLAHYAELRGAELAQQMASPLRWLQKEGLVIMDKTDLRLTAEGLRLGDGVMSQLLE
uniref:Heme chaperone HemW n=1 Tax=Magnetococcus massalia (strain MO-1) TaxID=451514 RepID=A0A1S7LPD8_MAGMO|nr:Putative Oxygen-independent coproporphyrinogen-III oxidase-like protein [Candidatus Magnetococcus massalia]